MVWKAYLRDGTEIKEGDYLTAKNGTRGKILGFIPPSRYAPPAQMDVVWAGADEASLVVCSDFGIRLVNHDIAKELLDALYAFQQSDRVLRKSKQDYDEALRMLRSLKL